MKILLIFIFAIPLTAYSQTATIREIKFRPSPKYYNTKDFTIIFPIVITHNKIISSLINEKIADEILATTNEEKQLKKEFRERINDGLTDLSYEITFNKNDILSMHIYTQESGGNHLTSSESYFNFDLQTGEPISISDLIYETKIDSFRRIVFKGKVKSLLNYKKEAKNDLLNNQTDSSTYSWILEQVDSNCIKDVRIEDFSLSNANIEIIDPCEFPQVIRALEPIYKLKYSYKFISPFFKPRFQKRLFR